MSSDDALERVRAAGVVPVVTLASTEHAIPLCRALLEGGLPVVEITFRAAAAEEAIYKISDRLPEMCVGAGTLTDIEQAARAHAAGARFAVAPGFNPRVAEAARSVGLAFWPGVCTPSEIEQALRFELRTLKFFPAEALGGAATVKAMLAPYLHLGVETIPTGGIDEETAPSYWSLAGVAAVGGSWIAPSKLIESGDWSAITERAREAVSAYASTLRGTAS